jgi:hypothetical protein
MFSPKEREEDATTQQHEAAHYAETSPPPPRAEQNADTSTTIESNESLTPPQIEVKSVKVVARTTRRNQNGEILKENGQTVFEETILAVGSRPEDFSGTDFEVNLNNAVKSLESGDQVFLKVELGVVEAGNQQRAVFENNDKATISKGIPNIVSEKPVDSKTISSDGRSMTAYVRLDIVSDGISKGKLGTVTLRAQVSYIDEYDSTTNQVVIPKKVQRDVRITFRNIDPANTFLKKQF